MANKLPTNYTYDGPEKTKDDTLGSESNPYTPETCAQFMYAVEQAGKYVKLTKNIDFAKDEFYQQGITSQLYISCAKLYADGKNSDGSLIGINGLSINAEQFFRFIMNSGVSILVKNISFRNCIWSKISEGSSFVYIDTSRGSSFITFEDCSLSFLIKWNGYNMTFEGRQDGLKLLYYVGCSEFYTFSGTPAPRGSSTSYWTNVFSIQRQYCTVQFRNLFYYCGNNGSNYRNYFIEGLSQNGNSVMYKCTFVGDIELQGIPNYESITTDFYIANVENCCFALTMTNGNTQSKLVSTSGARGISIINKDTVDDDIKISTSTLFVALTDAQMKDQDYLTEKVGFLP